MNVWDGLHWNIYEILPYQRKFNVIEGMRVIGKTYTTQFYCLDKFMNKGNEFVNLIRYSSKLNKKTLEKNYDKVISENYPDVGFKFFKDRITLDGEVVCHNMAISAYQDYKPLSFPRVKHLIFDECLPENPKTVRYVEGWNEPNLLLNIYDTIDRKEDRVICFLLGNLTSFYNPYHMHEVFKFPYIEPGSLWKGKNVLFQRAIPSEALLKKLQASDFHQMTENSSYGNFSMGDKYQDEEQSMIESLPDKNIKYIFTIVYNNNYYGIWTDKIQSKVYVSQKYEIQCKRIYALTIDDHTENTLITKGKEPLVSWLAKSFKLGVVKFDGEECKSKIFEGIKLIL